jgi:hypothetical protein
LEEISKTAILIAEAPTEKYSEMLEYYGKGDEFHGAFHFIYNGDMMNTIKNEKRTHNILKGLHDIQNHIPRNTQDVLFLSNHDHFAGIITIK